MSYMDEDWLLSAKQLEEKHSPDGEGEHPTFTRWDWIQRVAQRGTLLGYWEWVKARVEGDEYA